MSKQREVPCPFCASHVKKKDVTGGKKEWIFKWFNPPLRVPIPPPLAQFLKPDPQKCSCEGKQKVKDVTDDTAKYEEVKQKAEASIDKTLENEAKLGTGGTRTTVVQSSDTLYVGLGFNRNDSFKIIPKGHKSPGSITPDPKTGAAFAKGYDSNNVVGIQTSPGWPSASGNYTIKCANSYRLLTGAGGIQMATRGPLTINAGIVSITGPQVNIGSSSGPLSLEGDVVSVTGKSISLTPTDANVFVKGTVSATGNMMVGGQMHAETLSFCKASCPSRDERSTNDAGNPDTTQTFPAVWGGTGVKGIISSIFDIQIYFANIISEFETAATNVVAPTQLLNLSNRMGTLAKMIIPIELIPTGVCITAVGPGIVYNFPHSHGLPSMNHSHATVVPDIDYKSYSSPQALRAKVMNDSLASNACVVPSNKVQDVIDYSLRVPGFIANMTIQSQKLIQWVTQTLS